MWVGHIIRIVGGVWLTILLATVMSVVMAMNGLTVASATGELAFTSSKSQADLGAFETRGAFGRVEDKVESYEADVFNAVFMHVGRVVVA